MRQNREGVVLHYKKGVQILEPLPTPMLVHVMSEKMPDPDGFERRISRSEMRQLLGCYNDLEMGRQVGAPLKPALSLRLYEITPDRIVPLDGYQSLPDCHAEFLRWAGHLCARVWENFHHRGDKEYWSRPEQVQAHLNVLYRGRRILEVTDQFMTGPKAPRREINRVDYISGLLDQMHARGTFLIVQAMPETYTRRQLQIFEAEFHEILRLAEELVDLLGYPSGDEPKNKVRPRLDSGGHPAITLDNGPLIALYVILYGSGDRNTRRRAMALLRRMRGKHEGLYDAGQLIRIFSALEANGHGSYSGDSLLDEDAGPSFGGLGGLIGLEARLASLNVTCPQGNL
ncbi:uncharacterized protein JN550_010720 [Neoarthrinium moseri]|uniref:uncharacterized protein n=1 Tax=Neoarthrinium moseri TaxID=1658444 RepID=UPI001FDC4850|nr:uncharacterized protein JN550_010720 [Neoarthrinium moseri]KAI1861780.1 hypothetical protein JN550_010720 [Neoarthrinium moseri]